MVKLEIATVKYNKKGEYDITLESEFKHFENHHEASKFVQKDVILFPVDETIGSEYYFYKNNEELPYETVIEKDIRKIFKEYNRKVI